MNISKPLIALLIVLMLPLSLYSQKAKLQAMQNLDQASAKYSDIAMQIWGYAELGYKEVQSTALLQSTLASEGFTVTAGVADMPTAFVAEYGSGKPVIAILAEFDALPGVSQKALPRREALVEGAAGHACGHHLFGAASVAAGVEIKKWLEANKKQGTIRVYGTPAEEGGAGKVYMVRAGLFSDVDAVLHWHPASSNGGDPGSSLANKSAKFRFYGESSHAAGAPERGRSALDGVEAMNNMVNMLREHVPQETRIHYVITKGGETPNVVPAFAEVYYFVRNPEAKNVLSIFEKVVNAARGAAIGTNTEMQYEVIHGLYNLLPNEALSEVMYANLKLVGGVKYNAEEEAFAKEIMTTYQGDFSLNDALEIKPYTTAPRTAAGSTDVGDVSWVVPTAGVRTATWAPGTAAHSWQAVAAGGTSIGVKGMMVAAKTITITAMDLYNNPEVIKKAKDELARRQGANFTYTPLLGDRKPPLDYRD